MEIESDNARVPDVAACLTALLPGAIPDEALADLLEAEPFPKVAYYEGHHPPLRGVAAFAVDAEEGTDESAQTDFGRLAFHPIEMLSGERWLVSVWHPSRVYVGSREVDEPPASPPPDVLNRVANRWIQDGAESAGDLGTLILYSLGLSHTDAGQTLHSWLDSWELDFFRRVQAGSALDTKTLTDLRGSIGEFSQRLREMRLKRKDEDRSWFAGITSRKRAEEVDQMLARALDDLRELSGLVRSSFDLVQLQIAQRQQNASIGQQQASERVQRKLELVTGLVLVPTLVVGVFGANTRLPGGGSWSGFLLMVLLMLILGGISYWWLRMARTSPTQTVSLPDGGARPADSAIGAPASSLTTTLGTPPPQQ